MSNQQKEENIPKRGRGRPRTVNITDIKTYNREFQRKYAAPKIKVTENTLLEDFKAKPCNIKDYSTKQYRTFYIFVKKLLEKDSIQINADYKDKFLGFFTQSNCVK
jgi:hypothetical protein